MYACTAGGRSETGADPIDRFPAKTKTDVCTPTDEIHASVETQKNKNACVFFVFVRTAGGRPALGADQGVPRPDRQCQPGFSRKNWPREGDK